MFPSFVINLDSQPERYQQFKERFSHTDLKEIKRMTGCDGKQNRNNPSVNPYVRPYLTDAIIGCGLSHIMLAKHIVDLNYPFALVLEDDVVPLRNDLSHVIYMYYEQFGKDVDVIRFFCQGICPKNYSRLSGSTAVYLITRKGAMKLAGMTLSYHIDVQMNNSCLVTQNINGDVFKTLDSTKHYKFPLLNVPIMNQKLGFWGTQTLFRIPILKINVDWNVMFMLLVMYACWSVLFHYRIRMGF
jgi:GR25 family glycosyltransferase involved in LPS biosynthesis